MTKKLSNTAHHPTDFYVVIPARYASTRLPGKPLLDIAGKPMVLWVVERAKQSGAKQVIVATDDLRIYEVVQQHGCVAVMTSEDHASGTDRIAEVATKQAWGDDAIVINVQGDEPLIDPALIAEVAATLTRNQYAVMATACHPIKDKADFVNPNVVKLVMDAQGSALYFSRAPIPYPRDADMDAATLELTSAYRHVGIYGYRASFLKQYAALQPSAIEQIECLEQLRVLHHGYKIAVTISNNAPATGVDTQLDLDYVRSILS
jgi:3-deoxy-manno-octulosonate cytidylyltransferase (CMP-KDO synthetase)